MLCLVRYLFFISTSVIDCLGRFISEMTYYVSSVSFETLLNSTWTIYLSIFAWCAFRVGWSSNVQTHITELFSNCTEFMTVVVQSDEKVVKSDNPQPIRGQIFFSVLSYDVM